MGYEPRILVVDDEESVCRSCSDILATRGWRVETALTGGECVRKTRDKPFDVVILDLKIPDISGIDLMKQIKALYPDTSIIVITGYSDVSSAIETMKMGVFDYIPKPFEPNVIRSAVERALSSRGSMMAKEKAVSVPNAQVTAPSVSAAPYVGFLTPKEVTETVVKSSKTKCNEFSVLQMILLGFLAGVYIAFGAQLFITVTFDLTKHLGVGFARFIGGSVFSVGLMLVVIGGAELFTGNCLCLVGVLTRDVSIKRMLRNWGIVYAANFAGALFLVLIMYWSRLWSMGNFGVGASAVTVASGKVSLSFFEAFVRGIGCNWLVCLAVWLALAGRDGVSKVFGIYFPIMAFVASGFEHSIANMYFIPIGLLLAGNADVMNAVTTATSNLTLSAFLVRNLLPVTLGNIVGGALFVGGIYYLVYLRKK
ncbi:MAG: formate/nitrite family transporter [Planctomycetota bacterium]|nr:formate/nitrite family transporter [Planctomycetota bacterium]